MPYVVGQQVFVSRAGHRHNSPPTLIPATVTKVGPKWTHVHWDHHGKGRFDAEGAEDAGFYPGRLWPSEQAWKDHRERSGYWDALGKERFWGEPPATLSTEDLRRFVEALTKAKLEDQAS